MQVIVYPGKISYIADSADWRLDAATEHFEIFPIATGTLKYSSGINLDNLAKLIVEAKSHAISRGISWDGN